MMLGLSTKFRLQFRKAFTVCCAATYLVLNGYASASETEAAQTDGWEPTKPITIIVPSNPGGGWDQTARFLQRAMIAEEVSPESIEVVNRGGAGGTIGLTELVERYDGDPHKLMISGFGMVGSVLMHSSEHTLLSTTPIARLTSEFQAIGVPADSPHETLDSLIAAFKDDPEGFAWGGGSAGGSDHIFAYVLAEAVGVDASRVNYVAFTGGGEANAAILGGQVDAGISGFGEWGSLMESGRIRLLAVASEDRLPDSDVATFQELGYDIVFANWRSIMAPPGITAEQRAWYTEAVSIARESEAWQAVLQRNNWQDSFLTGEEFEQFIAADAARAQRILSRVGLAEGESWAAVGPFLFPIISGTGLLLIGAFLAFSAIRQRGEPIAATSTVTDQFENTPDTKRFLFAAVSILAYIVGLRMIGFMYVTPVLIIVLSWIIGSRAVVRDAIVGVVLTGIIILIFENLLNVDIP